MSVNAQDQRLSDDAVVAFNRIGGEIKRQSLEILKQMMTEQNIHVADRQLVQDAYWRACQKVLDQSN